MRLASRCAYGPVLLVGFIGAGAVAVSVSKAWFRASGATPGFPEVSASATGSALQPFAAALGFVLLAGIGAVIATRGMARRIVGVLLVAAAAVVIVQTMATTAADAGQTLADGLSAHGWSGTAAQVHPERQAWWWITLAGGALSLAVGAAAALVGPSWPVMGAAYAAPADAVGDAVSAADADDVEELTEAQAWRAIDEGHDPTT